MSRQQQQDKHTEARESRIMQFSSNRGNARHRVRYTESGGALVDTGECRLCEISTAK